MTLIGRQNEKTLLLEIEKSNEPELVAVYGRRRVGKTFLIQNTFGEELVFEFTGTHHAALKNQLESFTLALTRSSKRLPLATPSTWINAFSMLLYYITPLLKKPQNLIFFY